MLYFDLLSMTDEERKVFYIIMGIFLFILLCYGIYYLFKNKDKN